MRFDGKLVSWNEDRGFGFIAPALGGDSIFVHVKAFEPRSGRPAVGQIVSFEVEVGPRGKKRAKAVKPFRSKSHRPIQAKRAGRIDGLPFLAIVALIAVYIVVAQAWRVPGWVAVSYVVMSAVCALAYLIDKSAAAHQRRRISEAVLLGFGLIGGWPGAIVAQQVLRHKTRKASFQSGFWTSVVVNVLAFAALNGPWLVPAGSLAGAR